MSDNLRQLSPFAVVQLVNSTPLGVVLSEQQLRKLRAQAGHVIGPPRKIDFLGFLSWLVQQRHQATNAAPAVGPDHAILANSMIMDIAETSEPGEPRLNAKQRQAIGALLAYPTQKEAAQAVGVKPNTICRWKKLPHFLRACDEVSRQNYERALAQASAYTGTVVQSVYAIATNGRRDTDRLKASQFIVDLAERKVLRMTSTKSGVRSPQHDLTSQRVQSDLAQVFQQIMGTTMPAAMKMNLLKTLLNLHEKHCTLANLEDELKDLEEQIGKVGNHSDSADDT